MLSFKQRYTALIQSGDYASQEGLFNCRSLLFVKVGRSKVNVYAISFGTLESKPVVSLYEKHMVLHYWPVDGSLYWKIPSFMKVRFKSIYTDRFVTFCNGTKSIFFPGMKVTYGGYPVYPYPMKHRRDTEKVLQEYREEKNAMERFYYHRKKAEERFQAAAKYHEEERFGGMHRPTRKVTVIESVDVSQLPITDVFKLENVSHRRYLIDYYGIDAILAGLDSEVVDKDVINGNPYELVVVKIPSASQFGLTRKGTYLRMVNPSTDEVHFEGVPNYDPEDIDSAEWEDILVAPTVRAALAWRDGESHYTVPRKIT